MNAKSLIPVFRTAALIATLVVGSCCARAQSGTNAPWEIDVHYRPAPSGYTAPANIVIWALLNQSNVVDTVQFFVNADLIGTVTNSVGAGTSTMVWTNAPAGDYELTAVVSTTSEGILATSQPVSLSITEAPTNAPPAVTNPPPAGGDASLLATIVFPANNAIFTAPVNLQLEAQATLSNSFETVQFFANSNIVATVTNNFGGAEFIAMWTNVPAGVYGLTAVVSNIDGATATSPLVVISVNEASSNAPPPATNATLDVSIGSPGNGNVFLPPATVQLFALATETNADEVVQFFANSNLIATVTNIPGSNVFVATWTNVPVGVYGLTAVVSTSDGDTATSLPVSISVSDDTSPPPAVPPPVTLASPTNAAMYQAPADVGLEATWSGGDPMAAPTVQFFANSNLITTVSNGAGTNMCFAAWTNVPAGSYSLAAVISYGTSAGSSVPVFITVGDDSTNGPVANVVPKSQLPVVGVFPGNPKIGARGSYVAGGCVYLSMAATNGMTYSLESSTDLINWSPVFTNRAINGGAQYVAPNGYSTSQFYRIVPAKP